MAGNTSCTKTEELCTSTGIDILSAFNNKKNKARKTLKNAVLRASRCLNALRMSNAGGTSW